MRKVHITADIDALVVGSLIGLCVFIACVSVIALCACFVSEFGPVAIVFIALGIMGLAASIRFGIWLFQHFES